MKSLSIFILLLLEIVLFPVNAKAQEGAVRMWKITDFDLQSSALIDEQGENLSQPDYQSNVYWFPVKVPSTVLTGLVANQVYPDPYIGMNNMKIPDASDSFNREYHLEKYSHLPNDPNPWKKPYWYRTTFLVPAGDEGRHFELVFKGINYRAAVWLNGVQIADSTQMAGMFAEYNLDVSKQIRPGEENALAVKIYPLDNPGLPAKEQLKALGDFYPNGGPTGDIGKNVTMLCSAGWDWIPPVRDRNMGIWQPVYLRTTGSVTIDYPHIITELPNLPDTSLAKITLKIPLTNHGAEVIRGKVNILINPENFSGNPIKFSQDVSVQGNSTDQLVFSADNSTELLMSQPHLWWPNGYGKPNLYRLRIEFETDGKVSDVYSKSFGIRTVSSKAVPVNNSLRRDFYVNGKRIFLLGGAWVPDMMLNRDSVRYDHELQLCRNANLNLVRIWGGGITPPDVFFDLADKYGLLIWSDFWITGDTQGEFKGSPDWPLEGDVFIKNMTSTILRIRNHPSLLVWTGGNEGHAREELYSAMRDSVIALDGTRPFIPCSSGFAHLPEGWKKSWPDNQQPGVYSGGPYSWKDPKVYYDLTNNAKDWVFKDETGIPSQPPYNIMSKIVPDLVWDKNLPFPLNNTWGYHDAATGNGHYELYYQDMVKRFGKPTSMQAYCDQMQLMNAMGYQGIFEAAEHKLNERGGVMLWKLNAAFPSVIWQIFDWYMMPNAGYYYTQNSCAPVHVQFNRDDSKVAVINRTYQQQTGLTVQADIYALDSRLLFHKTDKLNLDASDVKEVFPLAKILSKNQETVFLVLSLQDKVGKIVSRNTYWLSSNDDFADMKNMPKAQVDVQIMNMEQSQNEKDWRLKFTNTSDKLAFFVRPQLTNDGEEVLPSFWFTNYFSLRPNESIEVSLSAPLDEMETGKLALQIEGWNLEKQVLSWGVK